MSNNNIKSRGFTIVELLIVIVVIAILATISIVAYNGIQNRGKNSAAESAASQLVKKVQAFQTVQSTYPANAAAFSTVEEAKLEGLEVVTALDAAKPGQVTYTRCATGTGATITYSQYPSGTGTKTVGTC